MNVHPFCCSTEPNIWKNCETLSSSPSPEKEFALVKATLANLEEEIIREVMISEGGNISKTAETLRMKRQTLQHKLKKYGMKG